MSKAHEYLEKIRTELGQWQQRIDSLETNLDESEVKARETLEDLKAKKSQLQARLTDIEAATEDAWLDIKTGLDLAWDALKLGLFSAQAEFVEPANKSGKAESNTHA